MDARVWRRRAMLGAAACLLGIVALGRAAGEDPQAAYERIYGEESKKVLPKDAPAFAERLLLDAAKIEGDPALAELLTVRAREFYGRSPAGPVRDRVGELLLGQQMAVGDAQLAAGRLEEALQSYRNASALAMSLRSELAKEALAKIRDAQARQDQEKKLAALQAQWKAKPDDPALAQSLVLLYVAELDKPAEAVPYLGAIADQATKTYVPLAAKDAKTLEEPALKELGDWYRSLATKATPQGKGIVLARSRSYYELYLVKHTGQDPDSLAAKNAMAGIDKEFERLSLSGVSTGGKPKTLVFDLGGGVRMKLVLIPAGRFLMGSPETEKGRSPEEGPQHMVTITNPFYMGETEVTQEQYVAVMGKNPSRFNFGPKSATHPVEQVSWKDAVEFCNRLSQRTGMAVTLPTEAQWEYACRAGSKTPYCFGDDEKVLDDYAWHRGNSSGTTQPVGQKKPNAFGLYDMYGNVWELCSDFWVENYYASSPSIDPKGPDVGVDHVVRGDNCGAKRDRTLRSAYRTGGRGNPAGFHVVVLLGR